VDPTPGCKPIGTKWVRKNKEREKGEVVRNNSRLVAQGCKESDTHSLRGGGGELGF
jgi:hypothetical protein